MGEDVSQCIAYPPFPLKKIMILYKEKRMQKVGKKIKKKTLIRKQFDKVVGSYLVIENEYDKEFYTDVKIMKYVKRLSLRNVIVEKETTF